jgi:hypothetical protein
VARSTSARNARRRHCRRYQITIKHRGPHQLTIKRKDGRNLQAKLAAFRLRRRHIFYASHKAAAGSAKLGGRRRNLVVSDYFLRPNRPKPGAGPWSASADLSAMPQHGALAPESYEALDLVAPFAVSAEPSVHTATARAIASLSAPVRVLVRSAKRAASPSLAVSPG